MLESSAQLTGTQLANRPAKIPTTKGLPLVGSLPAMLRDPFNFVTDARNELGDLYWLNLGLSKVAILNHPRHAQYIMRDNARNYRKGGPMWDAVRSLLGNGLVVSEGDFWLRQRRMMQPHFHRRRLAGLTDLMVSAIQDALDIWEEQSKGGREFNLASRLQQSHYESHRPHPFRLRPQPSRNGNGRRSYDLRPRLHDFSDGHRQLTFLDAGSWPQKIQRSHEGDG